MTTVKSGRGPGCYPGRMARRSPFRKWLAAAAVAGLAALAGGCARVAPHQRELLARPGLQQPVWPGLDRGDQHMYRVREASTGATGAAAGGCGCN